MVKIGLVVILIAVIVIGYNGCGGSSSSSSGSSEVAKLALTGTIEGYSIIQTEAPSTTLDRFCSIFEPTKLYAITGDVDKIIAMPYEGGYLGEYTILESKSFPINLDGTFSLSLEKNRNWVLILVNSTLTGRDKFVGYVAMKTDANESTLLAPVSSATASSLDIGTVSQSITDSTLALTENALTTTAFSLSQSQLLDLAKNDDLLKIVKNLYFNYNNGVYWNLRPDYNWSGDYSAISGTGFPDPATYIFSGGYAFQLDGNFTGVTVQQLIGPPTGTPKALLELYPPSAVESKNNGFIYNTSIPISNATVRNDTAQITAGGYWETSGSEFFANNAYGNISYSFSSFTGTIPTGFWTMGITSTPSTLLTSAEFDVAVASPISGTVIKGFVPSIRVNVDGSKRITSVDVKWYSWNGSSYQEVTDSKALESLAGSFDLGFDNTTASVRRYESNSYNASISNVVPELEWYYGNFGDIGGAPESKRAESILVFYSCGGIGYFFFWNNWEF